MNYIYKLLSLIYCRLLKCRNNIIIGKNVLIDYKTSILVRKNNNLIIKNGVTLSSIRKGYHAGMPFPTSLLVDGENALLEIGENSRLNGVYVHAQDKICIGKNCVIAAGVSIIDSNAHVLKSANRTQGRDVPKGIFIGNNVWIGLNSIILKGTEIGDNSVISAGSIVKGKFSKNSLIQGNPAVMLSEIKI